MCLNPISSSQLLTVLINVQLGFTEKQRNQGIHILQKSDEAQMQRDSSFCEEQPKISLKEMFETEMARNRVCVCLFFKGGIILFLHQHSSRQFLSPPLLPNSMFCYFLFLKYVTVQRSWQELTKNFLTVFHLKEDASLKGKPGIQDRKIKLTGLLEVTNDFSVAEVAILYNYLFYLMV